MNCCFLDLIKTFSVQRDPQVLAREHCRHSDFSYWLKIVNLLIRNICGMKLWRKHTLIIKSFCVQKAGCIHFSSSRIQCSFVLSLKILWLTIVKIYGVLLYSRLSPTNGFKHTIKYGYCIKPSKNTCMKLALSLVKSATNYRASLKRVRKNI